MIARRRTDALVVGAGPVGLFTAAALAERNVRVQLIDKGWRPSVHSYALALHPGSLRLLGEMGIVEDLVERGQRIDRIAFYEGEDRLADVALSEVGGPYPFILVLPQSDLENALEKRVRAHKIRVAWNHQMMSAQPAADGVTAEVARMDKVSLGYPVARTDWVITKKFQSRAEFLVGADGYHSLVRRVLGFRYENLGGMEIYAVFEFASPEPLEPEMRIVFHEGLLSVLWPMTERRGRWSFQVPASGPTPAASVESLGELLEARAPWFQPVPREVYWATTTQFERRLVDRFGRDRAWLVGDAAHLTGPVGVQSMNVGMAEAGDLAERLARVIRDGADGKELEAFEAGRQREWRSLLGIENPPRAREEAPEWVKRQAARLVACIPASGQDLDRILGRIGLTTSGSEKGSPA